MGRKKWWRGGLELLMLCILQHEILCEGDTGCKFNKNLCDFGTEICYDDLVFGKCVPLYGIPEAEDLYRYNLDVEELDTLKSQLLKLESEGYTWSDPYTQCVIRTTLYNLQQRLPQDLRFCKHLEKDNDFAFRQEDVIDDKNTMTDATKFQQIVPLASINFVPKDEDSFTGEFANEIYYPQQSSKQINGFINGDKEYTNFPYEREERTQKEEPIRELFKLNKAYLSVPRQISYADSPIEKEYQEEEEEEEEEEEQDKENSYERRRKLRKKSLMYLNDEKERSFPTPTRRFESNNYDRTDVDVLEDLLKDETLSRKIDSYTNRYDDDKRLSKEELEFLAKEEPVNFDDNILLENDAADDDREERQEEYDKTFSRKYKHPAVGSLEFLRDNVSWQDRKRNTDEYEQKSSNYENDNKNKNIEKNRDISVMSRDALYTEGGLVQSLRQTTDKSLNFGNVEIPYQLLNDLDDMLLRRELSGFKRRERLDVKKPGPPFSMNNYAFKMRSIPGHEEHLAGKKEEKQEEEEEEEEEQEEEEATNNEVPISRPVKKELKNGHKSANNYKNVDEDYVYIEFQQEFQKWQQGEHVVNEIGKLLGLKPKTLRDIRVGRAEVTFKVVQNNRNFNATDVVNNIGKIRNKLREAVGVNVIRAGTGDKAKLPATLEVRNESEMNSTLFGAIVAAGVAAAIAAAIVTLIIVRRHAKSREKLAGLTTPDPEASKDYQELCRARMQAKQPAEKQEQPSRTNNTPRESESGNFLSNRSSTSSWTDEPAVTNMDISTGHMVLSYMEGHLKNKDRLDQEWAALCSYEAQPSAMDVAEKQANAKYNRPGAPLPYDHSRVVLNDLTNANNSDYINASTITDHDPRNPAYIVTQGPLPQTAPDFWQLVWEQGSVVIVSLTRLTEDGRAMCHRYWPDQTEGSELYHIYEVHLVSEHLWCDDYLVRSFYLKNLRTGETRTVTQFHFLSWPENGVPYSTKALLEFRRKVNKSYRGRSCPIVVHCSDGAGRTGTYCLIDMVLNRIAKGAKEIDIAATLEHIRDQRANMVATKQQFEFVLMAVAEEVHAILKALSIPTGEKAPVVTASASPPKSNQ